MKESEIKINLSPRITCDTFRLQIDCFRIERDYLGDKYTQINWKIANTGDWCIRVMSNSRDRDEPGNIVNATATDYYTWPKSGPTDKQFRNAVYLSCKGWLEHELREGLWIDGKRCFDPHKE